MNCFFNTLRPLSYEDIRKFTPEKLYWQMKRILPYIDIPEYPHLPSYHSTGGQRFLKCKWLISVNDFSELSYLNLADTTWYLQESYHQLTYTPDDEEKVLGILKNAFVRKVIKGLINYLSSRMQGDPKSSRLVRLFLWFFRITMPELPSKYGIFVFHTALKILYTHHNDSYLVIDLLRTCCASKDVRREFMRWKIDLKYLDYMFEKCYEAQFDVHQYLMNMKESIESHPGEKTQEVLPYCPVLNSILEGKLTHLARFIKYGFQREEMDDKLRHRKYEICIGRISYLEQTTIVPFSQHNSHYSDHRRCLQLEILIIVYYFALESSRLKKLEWLFCGYLLFRSIPDPYITMDEISAFFSENEDLLESIRYVCERYFPKIIYKVYEPRKLQHLCLCAVRSTLGKNFQLPKGIDRLTVQKGDYIRVIPVKIKNLLRLYSVKGM